jgi:hypothetical protein
MAQIGVVPPEPNHAPAAFQSRLSFRARVLLAVLSIGGLGVGVLGYLTTSHLLFVVVGILGVVASIPIFAPRSIPVIWGRPEQ